PQSPVSTRLQPPSPPDGDKPLASFRSPSSASGRQEIILHIGHSKTGSSFIQSSLALSVGALLDAGIVYPELPSFPFDRAKRGADTCGNLGHAVDCVDTIAVVAGQHAGGKRLLFSSEYLFERIADAGVLLAELQKAFDVTVILFLREFLAHAVSNFNHRNKAVGCDVGLGAFLDTYQQPGKVSRVIRAIEQAGCRSRIYSYSRHADHVLETFANAIGVPPDMLLLPPVPRVNRALDPAELYLAQRLNEVLGSSRELMAYPLTEKLPAHPVGVPRIVRRDYEAFRARIAPFEVELNKRLPELERYGKQEPILIEERDHADHGNLTFTTAQIDVLAESLGGEVVRLRH
ncbi:MAG: hypothetical protein WCJ21_10485, partial [Planctomycetota bacterium]